MDVTTVQPEQRVTTKDPFTPLGMSKEDIDQRIEMRQSSVAEFQPGMLIPWAGLLAQIPDGWLLCDGSAISRSEYADLFTAIGTQWGAGNGSTTFAIPNLTQFFLQGIDTDTTEPGTLGGDTSKSGTTDAASAVTGTSGTDQPNTLTRDHTHAFSIADIRPQYAEVAFIIKT